MPGYWPKDWTTVDANFGTEDELAELIQVARSKDMRILLDVIINHTGPVTGEVAAAAGGEVAARRPPGSGSGVV